MTVNMRGCETFQNTRTTTGTSFMIQETTFSEQMPSHNKDNISFSSEPHGIGR